MSTRRTDLQIDHLDHIDPNLQLWDVVKGVYITDYGLWDVVRICILQIRTQETCARL